MKRLEATAIYAVVMAALLVNGVAHSSFGTRMASDFSALQARFAPQMIMQARSSALEPLYTVRVNQKLAMAQAQCERIQARQQAVEQAKMMRDIAKLEAAKAKLATMNAVWMNSDHSVVVNDDMSVAGDSDDDSTRSDH